MDLISAMASAQPRVRRARIISYARPSAFVADVIGSAFSRTLLGARAMVEIGDLVDILRADHPEDYCVGASSEAATRMLALWRGDLSVVVVPISAFPARGGVRPDPTRLSIEDGGQTIRMGNYEVSFRAVLYERDSVFRRRARRKMIREERTLGASIRRLRLLRGVRRSGFPGLDEKTVARIERGEVKRPHRETMAVIARRLGVTAEELGGY